MKRDPRLRALSSDHHHALRLAHTILRASSHGTLDHILASAVQDAYYRELLPHFQVEEQILLPALIAVGAAILTLTTAPPVMYDALNYHLAFPDRWLDAGGFIEFPLSRHRRGSPRGRLHSRVHPGTRGPRVRGA